MISEHFFSDREGLFAALSADCVDRLKHSLRFNNSASILASGGSSPGPLYQSLFNAELDWTKVDIALVDERWVEENEPGSNTALITKHMRASRASDARFVAMKYPEETAEKALSCCESAYRELSRPFDLTILGMGPDGHTASLFPYADGLEAALDVSSNKLCAAIIAKASEVTGNLTERMTLTLHGILQSLQIHLLITGEEKLDVYKRALDNNDFKLMPVSAVLQQSLVPVEVYWAP